MSKLVHLDVEACSEELLRQQSYAIKNQLVHEANYPLCHKEPARIKQNNPQWRLLMPELVLYGKRLLAKQFLGTVLDIEVDQSVPESQRLTITG